MNLLIVGCRKHTAEPVCSVHRGENDDTGEMHSLVVATGQDRKQLHDGAHVIGERLPAVIITRTIDGDRKAYEYY